MGHHRQHRPRVKQPLSIITAACANLQFDIDDNMLSLEQPAPLREDD
ncbi:MAG: hypothetical protein M5U34_19610 [Chloroflexi bacterium]|nr:hypothetical protein [Chloroflexota bacterium]